VSSAPGTSTPRHIILGTAGHVDHGKTELVRALTGHDTDRLKEEKERGISIELGFAPLPLSDDVFVGVIDVPGHERFVRQMVAGAGGIDLAMLLVAADEGVMPQTVEHMEVLRSLNIQSGLVVISKSDLATADTLSLLHDEIAELTRGTFLENAPVVPVSARSGAGLDTLRTTLLSLARALAPRDTTGVFRLPIDRVFHQKGIGVVITGSAQSGRVKVGDELDLLPAGTRVRVREIQSFGAKRAEGVAGERLALALHGVKLDEIHRGDTLATPGRFAATLTLDARLTLASAADIELANRDRVRIHHGAREVLGRVILLEGDTLHAGETQLAQLRLELPLVADNGDRLVIRTYSPVRVIGGGIVIEARAQVHRRSDVESLERLRLREHGDPEDVMEKAIERAGLAGLETGDADEDVLSSLTMRGAVTVIGPRAFHTTVLSELATRITDIATAHTTRNPLQWGVDKEELRRRLAFPHPAALFNRVLEIAVAGAPVFVRGNRVRAGSPDVALPPALARAIEGVQRQVRAAGAAFLTRDELARDWTLAERFADAAQLLVDRGDVVEVGDGLADPAAVARVAEAIGRVLDERGEVAVGDLKEAVGVTRKHAIPLLEYFDRVGLTLRRGNVRVGGPTRKNSA